MQWMSREDGKGEILPCKKKVLENALVSDSHPSEQLSL